MATTDPWAKAANLQEMDEHARRLQEKMDELKIRKQELAELESQTKASCTVGRLPEENWDEDESEKPMEKADVSLLNKILHDKLINNKYDVEIERQNPNNPLFSVKSFEELRICKELLNGVYEMGFTYPSKIQESALPALLADPPQNMIAQSQSGTGKTAAFVLTMLSRVDPSRQHPQCLCLSPTYELAVQIGKVVEQMGKHFTGVKVAYAVRGGFRVERGSKLTAQIIIGTPGTVLDWVLKFRCFDPKLLSVFVLDEADLMIGMQGHQDQSIRIHKMLSDQCQHLLFSATYDDEVMDFAYKIISDPVVIRLRREEETLDHVKQYYVNCHTRQEKYTALCNLYGTLTIGQAIIFCRTKKEASWLAGRMSEDGHLVGLLSGELAIEQRKAIFERFKRGEEKVLISTNVTARGIDVPQVTIVINYDLPTTQDGQPDFEAYLHRIGRSGRFGKPGIAINFIDSNWSRNMLEQIEAHFGKTIDPLDAADMDALQRIESGE